MAATLIPGLHRGELHRLVLPEQRGAGGLIEEVRYGLGSTAVRGTLRLECGDWVLKVRDLLSLLDLLSSRELELRCVAARRPETRVAAAALGLETETAPPPVGRGLLERTAQASPGTTALMVHQGTLRSGDHLQCEGSLLLLGDVNPGGRISAGGHVLVWGRLRGVAHAGRDGNREARITAMQLRPLQLRIADAVARGPEEAPAPGQAEEARLVDGMIRIDPASPCWPLSD